MSFTAQYRSDDHELVRVYGDAEDVETAEGLETKTFDGDVNGLTWNPETLDFAATPSEPVDYTPPADTSTQIADLQAQIDTLTTAWLEG